jgi:exodeoxyribonuclease VII small subunit
MSDQARNQAAAAPGPAQPAPDDVATLPFEKALAELEEIVRQLEGGRVPLEDSIAIFERGEMLKRHCENLLKQAEARIDRITLGPDGQPTGTAPLDPI